MFAGRRDFLKLSVVITAAAAGMSMLPVKAVPRSGFKAVVFDAFPIFDTRPVLALVEQLFPGKEAELINVWRTKQFEYQWLRALSGNYADFWTVTEDSLAYACAALKLELTARAREQLMEVYLSLEAWPDVPAALHSLKQSGIRTAFLSNMSEKMLRANIKSAGLDGMFDQVLSSDEIRSFKPDPRVYQLGLDALKLRREEILFAAFAGWDAAGAKSFGYPTLWVNRLQAPPEMLGEAPDFVTKDLNGLANLAVPAV
jgi:2-haloacid dehalogenase